MKHCCGDCHVDRHWYATVAAFTAGATSSTTGIVWGFGAAGGTLGMTMFRVRPDAPLTNCPRIQNARCPPISNVAMSAGTVNPIADVSPVNVAPGVVPGIVRHCCPFQDRHATTGLRSPGAETACEKVTQTFAPGLPNASSLPQ